MSSLSLKEGIKAFSGLSMKGLAAWLVLGSIKGLGLTMGF